MNSLNVPGQDRLTKKAREKRRENCMEIVIANLLVCLTCIVEAAG